MLGCMQMAVIKLLPELVRQNPKVLACVHVMASRMGCARTDAAVGPMHPSHRKGLGYAPCECSTMPRYGRLPGLLAAAVWPPLVLWLAR